MRAGFRRPRTEADFYEGVRAVLVDETNYPKWTPPTLAEVDTDYYFKSDPNDKVLSL